MNYFEELRFRPYFKFLLKYLHPFFELMYRWDPTLPRIQRFMILYLRLMINFIICYFAFKTNQDVEDIAGGSKGAEVILVIVFIIVLSLLFLPLPEFFLSMFRSKYYLCLDSVQDSDD